MPVEAPGLIYDKMVAIVRSVGAIEKSQRNQAQNFNFRGIDDVMNAISPLLAEHGVFYTPEILEHNAWTYQTKSGSVMNAYRVTVRYHFYTTDGSTVSLEGVGEGSDAGDKATSKALASCLKYTLLHGFCIPTEELRTDDADAHTPDPIANLNPTVKGWLQAGLSATQILEIATQLAIEGDLTPPADLEAIQPKTYSHRYLSILKDRISEVLSGDSGSDTGSAPTQSAEPKGSEASRAEDVPSPTPPEVQVNA